MVRNLMEELVWQCLRDLQQHQELLRGCEEQKLADIMAITLNRIPPRYVSSSQGEMFAKTQLRQLEPEIYRELAYAIDKVVNDSRKSDF